MLFTAIFVSMDLLFLESHLIHDTGNPPYLLLVRISLLGLVCH